MQDGQSKGEVTQWLQRLQAGDRDVLERLLPVLYDELKRIARTRMRGERRGHTLQPTELVNEAYLRLIDINQVQWQGRTHFVSVASNVMRRVLIDHARKRQAAKRGAVPEHVPLTDDVQGMSAEQSLEYLALDAALSRLSQMDERQARIVELRFFGGLTVEETASALGVSPKTVKRDWAVARAWLQSEMRDRT